MNALFRFVFYLLIALGAVTARADPSLVQFSTAGNGVYNVKGIVQFDWQSSGDLVIVDKLPGSGSTAGGSIWTTFAAWAANAVVGDVVDFNIHTHARLNDMLDGNGGSVAPTSLSRDGATCFGPPCFEITVALSDTVTAKLISVATPTAAAVIQFDFITADYKFFFDSTPDSNVTTTSTSSPTNFSDGGKVILQGTSVSVGGTFGGGVGASLVSNTIASYDPLYIQTNTAGLVKLNASTFDNLVTLVGGLQAQIAIGQPIGLLPYSVLSADLRQKIDSNSKFFALPVQPPGVCRVTGGGNDVDENIVISNNDNQPFPNTASLLAGYAFNPASPNSYTYGGQVGAPTVPFGEWTHHQKDGQTADFVFHAGSHSAPKDTAITAVVCSDPVACKPAVANAGFKQIDYEGTGSFRTIQNGKTINGFAAVADHETNGTRHYFRVHIEDLGEPGGAGGPKPNSCTKKPGKFANPAQCTACPDIYQIEIHATASKTSAIIYTVGAFVNGGNLQIHPPVK